MQSLTMKFSATKLECAAGAPFLLMVVLHNRMLDEKFIVCGDWTC